MKTMRGVSPIAVLMSAAVLCLVGLAEAQAVNRTVPGPGEITTDPGDLEAFRADLATYIRGMKAVADAAGLPSGVELRCGISPA
jgi:hypothetical protein